MVGENSIGMRLACRSFHAETKRPASSSTPASVARLAAASFSAASARRASIFRRLNPMPDRRPTKSAGQGANSLTCSSHAAKNECPHSARVHSSCDKSLGLGGAQRGRMSIQERLLARPNSLGGHP